MPCVTIGVAHIPERAFRLLNDGYSYDDDECNSLLRWMPESWKPPVPEL